MVSLYLALVHSRVASLGGEPRPTARHRHVPKAIKKAADAKREASAHEKHKMDNRRAHAKPGAVPHVNTREKAIVREVE